MHPRNLHKNGYPISLLCKAYPSLTQHVVKAKSGQKSIDFSRADSVKALNAALLAHYYGVTTWDIPSGYLCPPVPGRADYIHSIADLLAKSNGGEIPTGTQIKALDIGVGANVIYPILGTQSYGWKFVGSDIDTRSVASAKAIVKHNKVLTPLVDIRQQNDKNSLFAGVVGSDEQFSFTMCNPPFHKSAKDARVGTVRKNTGLQRNKHKRGNGNDSRDSKQLNFAGQANELWCEGGELAFIQKMIAQSVACSSQVGWFTCLVSKSAHLKPIETSIRYYGGEYHKIDMGQGNKQSRFVAWRFV